jgi:hypothetical protein
MKQIFLIFTVSMGMSIAKAQTIPTYDAIELSRGAWPYIRFTENGINTARIQGTGGNFAVTSLNGATNYFTVNSTSGNVGVGTNSPTAKLEINQPGYGLNLGMKIWAGNNNNIFTNSQIQLSWNGGAGAYSHAIKSRHMSGSVNGNAIDFYLWQPGDPINGEGTLSTMTLNGGNVGIGTTTPIAKLHMIIPISTSTVVGDPNAYGAVISDNSSSTLAIRSLGSGTMHLTTDGSGRKLVLGGGNFEQTLFVNSGGNVGIGTSSPDAKLAVSGQVHAQEVKVSVTVPGPDYVFEKDYKLTSLEEIKNYIDQNKHLPEVPSAKEMEKNGVQLGEMNMLLLKKIEELTLYVIEQKNEISELRKENKEIKRLIKQ